MMPTCSFSCIYIHIVLYWQNIINDPFALPDFDKNCPYPEKCAEVSYSEVHSYFYYTIQLLVGAEVS